MALNTSQRLPIDVEWSAWVDLASDNRPRYIGTEDQVKREYRNDPDWRELYRRRPARQPVRVERAHEGMGRTMTNRAGSSGTRLPLVR
jgi:hypothetical protein